MGCVEPQKAGRLYQWTSTAYTQWPICIELVLNHGVPLWYGKQVCPDMGDLNSFKTYEEFEAAVKEEIKYITKWTSVATVISQRVHRAGSEASDVHYVRGLLWKRERTYPPAALCITLDQALYGPDLLPMQTPWQPSRAGI